MSDDIKFACEKCGQSVSIASVHAGASLHCPGCGGSLTVPTVQPGTGAANSGTGGITFKSEKGSSEHAAGELIVKRYRLERVLGRGGMGVVGLAKDEQLNEKVALKFVPPEIRSDKDALKDLRRETQKSRKLSHPNIIRIHDLNQSEDTDPFISMEFVAGETMSSLRVCSRSATRPERRRKSRRPWCFTNACSPSKGSTARKLNRGAQPSSNSPINGWEGDWYGQLPAFI
ncbi:MAG: protein kinase domain-containing protein [Limisphaerales bacterium]